MEKQSFVIRFEFWLLNSDKLLTMEAIARPDKTEHSYLIHSFHNSPKLQGDQISNEKLVTPYICIRRIERDGQKVWVHGDSGKETIISAAIGKAIESHDQFLQTSRLQIPWQKKIQSR